MEDKIEDLEREDLLAQIDDYNKKIFFESLENFKSIFESCKTNDDRRMLVKSLVKCIYLDGINKKVEIETKF